MQSLSGLRAEFDMHGRWLVWKIHGGGGGRQYPYMTELQRVTLGFSPAQDRLRLAGEDAAGHTVVLWLTQRLLNRLVPELVRWLEAHQGERPGCVPLAGLPRAEALLSFAQHEAQRSQAPAAPVQARPGSGNWLVEEVNLRTTVEHCRMNFRGGDGQVAGFSLTPTGLRQWLGMVHRAYLAGGWPTGVWPVWISENAPGAIRSVSGGAMLH